MPDPLSLDSAAFRIRQTLPNLTDPAQVAQAQQALSNYDEQVKAEGRAPYSALGQYQADSIEHFRGVFADPTLNNLSAATGRTIDTRGVDDPAGYKIRSANTAWLATMTAADPRAVAMDYDHQRDDYAKKNFGQDSMGDAEFFNAVGKSLELKDSVGSEAAKSAMIGEPWAQGFAKFQTANASNPAMRAADVSGYQQTFGAQHDAITQKLAPYREAISNILGKLDSPQAAADELRNIPPADRDLVFAAIAAQTDVQGESPRAFFANVAATVGRGSQSLLASTAASYHRGLLLTARIGAPNQSVPADSTNPVNDAVNQAIIEANPMQGSGLTPDLSSFSAGNTRALTSDEQKQAVAEVEKRLDDVDLAGKARQFADSLDPVKAAMPGILGGIEQHVIYNLAGAAPMILASLNPATAWSVVMPAMANDTYTQLRQQYPSMSRDQAIGLSSLAAPFEQLAFEMHSEALMSRLPAVNRFFSTPILTGGSGTLRFATKAVVNTGAAFAGMKVSEAAPALVQGLISNLSADVPEVNWKARLSEFTDPEHNLDLLAMIVPMTLVSSGHAAWNEVRGFRSLVKSPDALVMTGVKEGAIAPIITAANAGEYGKAQTLLRQAFDPGAPDPAMKAKQAATAQEFMQSVQQRSAAQSTLQGMGDMPVIGRTDTGWKLSYQDGHSTEFPTHQEADVAFWDHAAQQELNVQDAEREFISRSTAQAQPGEEYAFKFNPEQMTPERAVDTGLATPEAMQRRKEQAATLEGGKDVDADFTRGQALTSDAPEVGQAILGRNSTEMREGVMRHTIELYQGHSLLTTIEEKLETDANKLISSGQRDWLLGAVRDVEQRTGSDLLPTKDDAKVQDSDLKEAYSHLGSAMFIDNAKSDNPVFAKGKEAVGRLGAMVASTRKAIMESKASPAMIATGRFLHSFFRRADQLGELRKAGKGGDIENALAKSLGIDQQHAHEKGVLKEASGIAKDAGGEPEKAGMSLAPGELDSRLTRMFDPFQRSPELRQRIGLEVQRRTRDVIREVEDANLGEKNIESGMQALAQRHGEELASREADYRAEVADLQRERDHELAGAKEDKASKADTLKIQRQFDKKLADRDKQWLKEKAAVEKDQQGEASRLQSSAEKTNARDKTLAWLRTLDALTSALPPEVRAKVGGYTKIAGLTTDEARLKEVERRADKMDQELEKYLKKDLSRRFDTLLERAAPKGGSGEKSVGKIGVEGHRLFRMISDASNLSEADALKEIQSIDAQLAGEIPPEEIKKLSDFGVTNEDEARTFLEHKQGILMAYGDFAHKSAAEMATGLDYATKIYKSGRADWMIEMTKRAEARAAIRETVVKEAHAAEVTDAELRRKEGAEQSTLGEASKFLGEHLELGQAVAVATGEHSETRKWVDHTTLKADLAHKDAMDQRNDALTEMFHAVLGGNVLGRMKQIEKLSTRRDFDDGAHHLSQMEGVHFSMLWKQEGLRDALKAHGYGEEFQQKLERWLSPEAKAIRSWLWDQYDRQYERINESFKKRYGVDLPRVQFYAPAFFETRGKDSKMSPEGEGFEAHLGGLGSLKNRTRHTARPEQVNAVEAYIRNAHQVEHWIAWNEGMADLRAVFGSVDTNRAIKAGARAGTANVIRRHLDVLEANGAKNADSQGAAARWMRRLQQGTRDSVLLFNLAVMTKHAHSAISSASDIGAMPYLLHAGKVLAGRGAMSYYDMLNSRTIERRRDSYSPEWKAAASGFKADAKSFMSTLRDVTGFVRRPVSVGLDWARQRLPYVDSTFAAFSAATAYDYHFEQARGLGMDDATAHAEALKNTELTLLRTAIPESLLSKSLKENEASTAGKSLWMFMGPSRKSMGLAIMAQRANGWASGSLIRQVGLSWIVSGLVVQTLGNLMRHYQHQKDWDEDFKLSDYARAMAMGPMSGVYMIGPIFEALSALAAGSHYEPRSASVVADLVHGGGDLFSHLKKGDAETKDYGKTLSTMGSVLGGEWAALGVTWTVLKQALGIEDHFSGTPSQPRRK